MKKTIKHYHFSFKGKNILCAVEYENHIKKYDVSIWCDNQYIGRDKIRSYNREQLLYLVKAKLHETIESTEKYEVLS